MKIITQFQQIDHRPSHKLFRYDFECPEVPAIGRLVGLQLRIKEAPRSAVELIIRGARVVIVGPLAYDDGVVLGMLRYERLSARHQSQSLPLVQVVEAVRVPACSGE